MRLDEKDLRILEILKKDSRTHFTAIGKDLGVTDATIYFRVKNMVEAGIIKKFTIIVDDKKLNSKLNGFLLMNVIPGHMEEVTKALMENKYVNEVYEIYTPNDLMAKITADDLEKLRDCVQEIRQIPNISGTTLITGLKKWEK